VQNTGPSRVGGSAVGPIPPTGTSLTKRPEATDEEIDQGATMALHHMTCPHCGSGFNSHDATQNYGEHHDRDATPRHRDTHTCPTCKTDFETRPQRAALASEKKRKGADRIE
jgi:uncharacterized Zn finger protein (UPF0148 family)